MPSVGQRLVAACVVVMASTALVAPAAAAEPEPQAIEESARLAYMDALLRHYESASTRYRTLNAALGLARGAVSVPVGGFVLSGGLSVPGVVLVANGALAATGGLLDLLVYKEPFAELREHFLARERSSASVSEILDATEREWLAAAHAVRRARIRSGVAGLGVGALLIGFGAVLGFHGVDAPSSETSATDRASFTSLLIGFGGMNASTGLRSLLVEDPIESGWQSYAQARSIWGKASLNVVALSGGVYVGLSSAF